jgi:hypothetical protein
MTDPTDNPSESLVRFSRRSMGALLVMVLFIGLGTLAMTLWPDAAASRRVEHAPWLFPVGTVVLFTALRLTLFRGQRWDPRSPEAKAILNDELRQTSLSRASRTALLVVLVAQLPLGLLFGILADLPAMRATLAMVESTIMLGMATFIALFLFFDRE